ncbi:MAG TPA: SIMPL domain-containing protein [Acidimicrobiia bacterium]|jgi:uncharacterized protein YggE|nr:SIMPL domain-containing protein [Acidimicrobiia bacterium]
MSPTLKAAFVGAAGLALLAGCSSSGSAKAATPATVLAANTSDAAGPTIAVSGHGKVEGTPDLATVTLGVETHDPSAQAALARNNDEAQKVIDTLKSKGVNEKDIQTSDLSVNPDFDKDGHITGYSVSNTVTVKLRDLSKAGATIDAAAAVAGNDIRMQGVMFSIDDSSALVAKARADAVKDALAQGHQLADAAQVNLGSIQKIDDTGTTNPYPLYLQGAAAHSAMADVATPIQTGTQELTVDVTVIFAIA